MANASVALSGQQAQQAAAAASGAGYDNTLMTGPEGAAKPSTTTGKALIGQ